MAARGERGDRITPEWRRCHTARRPRPTAGEPHRARGSGGGRPQRPSARHERRSGKHTRRAASRSGKQKQMQSSGNEKRPRVDEPEAADSRLPPAASSTAGGRGGCAMPGPARPGRHGRDEVERLAAVPPPSASSARSRMESRRAPRQNSGSRGIQVRNLRTAQVASLRKNLSGGLGTLNTLRSPRRSPLRANVGARNVPTGRTSSENPQLLNSSQIGGEIRRGPAAPSRRGTREVERTLIAEQALKQ